MSRVFIRMRQVQRRSQCRLLAQLVGCEDLGDRQDLGPIRLEIGQCDRTVAGTEVNPETESSHHDGNGPAALELGDSARSAACGRHFTSISAGAIAGSRSAAPRSNGGNSTLSDFQPRWTSTPEKGADPTILPTSRYSSA